MTKREFIRRAEEAYEASIRAEREAKRKAAREAVEAWVAQARIENSFWVFWYIGRACSQQVDRWERYNRNDLFNAQLWR